MGIWVIIEAGDKSYERDYLCNWQLGKNRVCQNDTRATRGKSKSYQNGYY